MPIGTVKCYKNEYFVNRIPITNVHKYLVRDVIQYNVIDGKAVVENILKREEVETLGVTDRNSIMRCPLLSDTFQYQMDIKYAGKRLLVSISKNFIYPMIIYGDITDRTIDEKIIHDLYSRNSNCPKFITEGKLITTDVIDLRHLNTFSIDPVDSMDFDDAISIDENYIYVHIVDISNQIPLNSDIDVNAFARAFTLYLGNAKPFNIFPDNLAEDKLSLIEGEDRNVLTVKFDYTGFPLCKPFRSLIKNKKRYNYDNFILSEKLEKFTLEHMIKNKFNIGNLEFKCDKNGKIIFYKFNTNNDLVHKFIETLMILTNIFISSCVINGIPQRFHKNIEVSHVKDMTPLESVIFIKTQGLNKAIYSEKNGHSALGLKTYTHFTSPIRRYFDVIVHRILQGLTYVNIEEILTYINSREIYIRKLVSIYNDWKLDDYISTNVNNFTLNIKYNIIEELLKNVDVVSDRVYLKSSDIYLNISTFK